jgi:peptidoglycan/LPS O-acetylase OafA/YrhL
LAIAIVSTTLVESPPTARFYRPELDVLRFFAFFLVFIRHVTMQPASYFAERHIPVWASRMWLTASNTGSYGVDLFFTLSSYLITELLLREKSERGTLDVRAFYIRRILRIWPLYFFFLLLVVTIPFCSPEHQFTLRYVFLFLVLLGNWAMVVYGWPNCVANPLWSVSVEEQFYLLWPPIVARLNRRGIIVAAAVMIVVANLTRICVCFLHGTAPQLWGNSFAHLDSIAAGILIAVFLNGRVPKIKNGIRAGMIGVALFALLLRAHFSEIQPQDALGWGETILGWPAVAAACASILIAFTGVEMNLPFLRYLGKISYGLYVYHLLCVRLAEEMLKDVFGLAHMVGRLVLSLGLTIIFAGASYTFLETPFLRLKSRFAHVASRPV